MYDEFINLKNEKYWLRINAIETEFYLQLLQFGSIEKIVLH